MNFHVLLHTKDYQGGLSLGVKILHANTNAVSTGEGSNAMNNHVKEQRMLFIKSMSYHGNVVN